ncbi:MAG: ACP S-malonyltransferase [Spirochaetes bacterium]|nr:ACP S-malonyltransferase [Spirochaetota bacterium]
MTKIYLFPGQGSQKKGMGAGLFEAFPDELAQARAALGYDLAELCLNDPQGQLDQTAFTQPALYAVSALTLMKKLREGEAPHAVAGHSLGEYDALFAAGVFDFVTGLRLVQKRGEIMAKQSGGGMAAIVGLEDAKILQVIQDHGYQIDVANYNSDGQTVVSGLKADVEKSQADFEAAGARMVIPLKVSGAFHSRFMKPAADEFAAFLESIPFQAPKIPVYSNVTAQPHQVTDLKANMARQIHSSVRWVELVQNLMALPEAQFEEVGPGTVLTGLLKRIKKKA